MKDTLDKKSFYFGYISGVISTVIVSIIISFALSAFAGGGEPVDLDDIKPQETGSQGVIDVHEDEKDEPVLTKEPEVNPCEPEEVIEFDLGYDDEE